MLPKVSRMKEKDITLLFSNAKNLKTPLFIVKFQKNQRLIFSVAPSKKIFKTAVERNKVKRRIYNAIKEVNPTGLLFAIVIIPNKEALKTPYRLIVEEVGEICKELRKS